MNNTEFKPSTARDIYNKALNDKLLNFYLEFDIRRIGELAKIAPEGKEAYIKRVIFAMKENIENNILSRSWANMSYQYGLFSDDSRLFDYLDEQFLDDEYIEEKGLGVEVVIEMRKTREKRLEEYYLIFLPSYLKCKILEDAPTDKYSLDRLPPRGDEQKVLEIKRFLLENKFIEDISDRDFLYWFGFGAKRNGIEKIMWLSTQQVAYILLNGIYTGTVFEGRTIKLADIERVTPKCFRRISRKTKKIEAMPLAKNKETLNTDVDKMQEFVNRFNMSLLGWAEN